MDEVFFDDGEEVLSDDEEKVGEEDPVLSDDGAVGNEIGADRSRLLLQETGSVF